VDAVTIKSASQNYDIFLNHEVIYVTATPTPTPTPTPEPDPDAVRAGSDADLREADVPGLHDLPSGCPFHPRCPRFEAGLCDVQRPLLVDIGRGRRTACHLVERDLVREAGQKPTNDRGTLSVATGQEEIG